MSKVIKKLSFDTSFSNIGSVNSGFAKVKVLVMTHEQIANNTKFSKSVVNDRKSGLNYLPIVGEFKENDEDFGTHGGKLEITDEDMKYIDTTKPYGVVMEDTARWEKIKMKNGEMIEYLTVEAYLWIDRYPELQALYDGKLNNQSMEVNILDGAFNEDSWVYEVKDFEFSALCILGKDVKPAFHEAKVEVEFSEDRFKGEYQKMMFALNKYLETDVQSEVENLEDNKKKFEEEDVEVEVVEEEVENTNTDDKKIAGEDVETEETEEVENEDKTDSTDEIDTEDVEDESEEEIDYKSEYEKLKNDFDLLDKQLKELKEFKERINNDEKVSLIETYKHRYSLDDEDIKDIVDNVKAYTKNQIEEKLCTIIVKADKKVNFTKENVESKITPILDEFTQKNVGSAGLKAILQGRK